MNTLCSSLLSSVRARRPLVHHITNAVTIGACADITRCAGAAPVMAQAVEEVEAMVALSQALVLNIGTIDAVQADAMVLAAAEAKRRGIPVVLDACGAGATAFRDAVCTRLLMGGGIGILKGNASEIASIAGHAVRTRGVDSGAVDMDPGAIAVDLALCRGLVVVLTGAVDQIAAPDGRLYRVANGCPLMGDVVGTGCMAASVIGSFAALGGDLALAASAALVCYGLAGEMAARRCGGPASFRTALGDALASLDEGLVLGSGRLQEFSGLPAGGPN